MNNIFDLEVDTVKKWIDFTKKSDLKNKSPNLAGLIIIILLNKILNIFLYNNKNTLFYD